MNRVHLASETRPNSEADARAICELGAMTIPQAETFSGLSRTTLYEFLKSGRLTGIKVARRRLVSREELIDLLAESVLTGAENDTAT